MNNIKMHIILVRYTVKAYSLINYEGYGFVNILLNNYSKFKCEDIVNARLSRKKRQVALINMLLFQVCLYIYWASF